MSISRYFIDRPIFAWVLAILVCLFGLLAIRTLPIAQFPALAPPQIGVTAIYPGADATTLDKTTTQIIEQQLQGIDNLRYFSSQSSSSGQVTITLTFEQGTNPDTAQIQVNNKVQAALPQLPQEVQRQGVRVEKSSANFALVPGLYSADGSHDQNDLADLMASKIQEPVARINGVGSFQLFGSQYAMRIWVDPMKLNSFQLTMADVTSAVQAQNAQVSAGQIGNLPAPPTQQLNATVTVQSRLQTPEEFGTIRLKTAADGSVVRLRDVARVELGSEQ
jgi:multidrug efflux pump subunit AcrB